ncbi:MULTISPECIES: Crp/Fnr family transcriptional regulator [unclassified Streptomyces]|uniref:Crp/Fnr family transcriptional regulator n=1 Tax=unclassified Streptomyces TaxID=2593676 RepID=UPI002E1631BB|nr:helix-turn-helix domain-containing protein [Streptomyces sp. NBC_01296]WSW63328.1 helix-turn-helix domain-containing protein [Streptomyces sp. NBC_00998]
MSLIEQEQPLLHGLRPQDRAALLALGVPRRYEPGAVILSERATTSHVVAITGGWAVVSVTTERGNRLLLALRGAGELVGELAAMDLRPRSAKHDLAASVGSTREAVAKALRLLRERGIVRTGSRRLVVTDLEPLRLLADGGPPASRPGV